MRALLLRPVDGETGTGLIELPSGALGIDGRVVRETHLRMPGDGPEVPWQACADGTVRILLPACCASRN